MINLIFEVFFGETLQNTVVYWTQNAQNIISSSSTPSSDNITSFSEIYNIFMYIGLGFVLLAFFMNMMQENAEGRLTIESLLKSGAKSVISCLLIINGVSILNGLLIFSVSILRLVSDSLTKLAPTGFDMEYAKICILTYLNSGSTLGNFINAAGKQYSIIMPFAFCAILYVMISLMMISNIVELIVRAIFAPIALTGVYEKFANTDAMIYLKKFLATALQGAVIVGLITAFSLLSAGIMRVDAGMQRAQEISVEASANDAETAKKIYQLIDYSYDTNAITAEVDEDDKARPLTEEEIQKQSDELTSTEKLTDVYKDQGKMYYEALFSSTSLFTFITMIMALIIAITRSRHIANVICGL